MNKLFNAPLTLDLQFFAEGDTEPTPETNPNGEVPAEPKVETSETPPQAEKTYTQAQIDEMITKRVERERKKFADYEELKTKASEYDAKLEAQRQADMTETQKAQEQAKKFEEQYKELAAQLEAERTKAQQDKIRFEFTKVASSANIIDIDAAIALSDLSAVTIDEDGKVVGVDDVINALVENKPYLVAQKKQQQPIGTATNGGSGAGEKTVDQLLAEAAEKARKSGTIIDKVNYVQLKKKFGK